MNAAHAEILTTPRNDVTGVDEKNNEATQVEMGEYNSGNKRDAAEAETLEAEMTVLQAVARYPMACFWATVMSSTIVCFVV
jgi:hypothetical protein